MTRTGPRTGRGRAVKRSPPRPVRPRAVITDIDGTLTDAHRRLDPEALRAVRRLEGRGIRVILATGNVLPIALALYRSLGLSGPIVAENGGMLYFEENGTPRVRRLCRRGPALAAYRLLRRRGFDLRPLFTDRWRESEVAVEATLPVEVLQPHVAHLGIRVEGTGYAVHLMERHAGKLPALRRALAPLGLRLSDCLSAGDGDNDAEMLRATGWSVSFRSGSERARAAARFVARRSYAAGFVEALKASGVLAAS